MRVNAQQQEAIIQMMAIAQAKRDGIPITESQIIRKGQRLLEMQEKMHPELIYRH